MLILSFLWAVLTIWLIYLRRLGFSFNPLTLPPLDWWGHPMPQTLRAYLKKHLDDRDFTIHYYLGGGLGGQTSFYLQGDGSYELWSTVTKGYERKIYSGQVPVLRVEQVVQEMLAVKIWRVRHNPSTRLDDAKAMVSVNARGKKTIVMLWLSEIRESPPFVAVQRPLLGLIREVSKGEVLENGRGTNQVPPQVEPTGPLRNHLKVLTSWLQPQGTRSLSRNLRQQEETSKR